MSNGAATRVRRSREKILAAAETVFLQHGFLGTNMDVVAEKAGVSKQTVYAHFKSKEALFIEVVEAMTGGAAEEIGEDIEDVFGDQRVEDYLREVAIDQLTVVLTPRLMQLRRMVIGEVERFPELGKSLYINGPMRSIKRLTRACDHFTSVGQLYTPHPEVAATQFNWIVMGAPTNAAMLLGDKGIPQESQLRAHAKEAVRIFLCAYGVHSP
ncbi:TetR/AcrR family transcriptional regulator [Yoonia sp. F2084L]|uniref:TetR/AcrR family transcriptional regulator n=1 Tax=Yoonia sp. F2084L TaxID=2926419 RepID=UPI001FF40964|nr:TetR/AcrR family transcriptional regulator [Yoonia sp. F2084L]MCK0095217.1 TetR/AcrR family transcriptional regulator [Yoonia sp. F2084L]